MYLLTINLDSPGQFLRLMLWIALPIAIFYLLLSTWMRYRRNEKEAGGLRLAVEGFDGHGAAGEDGYAHAAGNGYVAAEAEEKEAEEREEVTEEEAGKETIYRGILWMKQKYEQYREQADKRYELLREELGRSEQRYQDLLLSIEQNGFGGEKRVIDELEEQLRIERLKVEELVIKLQTNSQLLLNIYRELDKSIDIAEGL